MKNRIYQAAKLRFSLFISVLLISLFQNCGQINVQQIQRPSIAPTPFKTETVSYLKIDNSITDIFRAVFIVDMSESMFAGPCPDSIDVMIPDVVASPNCLGPTGVDPKGNRFEVMLAWLDELQTKVDAGILTNEQLKILVLPYSGPNSKYGSSLRWGLDVANKIAKPLNLTICAPAGNLTNLSGCAGFMPALMARNYLYILWAIESKYHNQAYSSRIPTDIKNAVLLSSIAGAGNSHASTGTSMVAAELETMNQQLNVELNTLKMANLLGKAHFELVYFSDGVPKPHPVHIEAAAQFVWARKKKVCDGYALYPANANCEGGYSSDDGVTTLDARSCITRCADYLKSYADTGAVDIPGSEKPICSSYYSIPYMCSEFSDGASFSQRWTTQIKCGQCFKVLSQYDWDNTKRYYSFYQDNFKTKIEYIWGDWTQNRHANTIGKLKTTVNIFKIQHPGAAAWKMSFIRIDSTNPLYQTQKGEMNKDLNWIVKAQDYFAKKHRFLVLKSTAKPFELFQELENGQSYKLGMLYAYNRNLRVANTGLFLEDSDGDGIADLGETSGEEVTARSNNICLDNIKKIYSQCISTGCNPAVDRDGDGLNQCEEATTGSDDFEADTDEDGILDGSEILFALNPLSDDQALYSNTDGFSNFEHFVKGYPALVNLKNIPAEKIINISADLVDYKIEKDNRGLDVSVPGYKIKLRNLPINNGKPNEIVVIARIDNFSNPSDRRWISKTYTVNTPQDIFTINLEDLVPLKLVAP